MERWTRDTYPIQANGKRRKVKVACIGYEKKEADTLGIQYVKPHELLHGPSWFITDDGYVIRCHKVKIEFKSEIRAYERWGFYTDMGHLKCAYVDGNLKFCTQTSFATFKAGGFRPIGTKNDYRKTYRNKRGAMFARAYVYMVIRGEKINWEFLGRLIRPDDKNLVARGKRTMRYWEIQQMIQNEFEKELKDNGVSIGESVRMLKEAYDVAKGKKDAQSMIRVAENYIDMVKKSKQSNSSDPNAPTDGIDDIIGRAERAINGIAEPTSDELIQSAQQNLIDSEQEMLLEEANKLLVKPKAQYPHE